MTPGRAFWAERTADNRRRAYPVFRGQHTADVVVIGGGLTGAAAAYVLASGGLDVVLLEADRAASGLTACGLGAILPEPDAVFRPVEAAAGVRAARAAWQEARRGAVEFASALKKLPTKCDLTPSALVINARNGSAASELRREQASRKGAGLDAPWLTPAAASSETGTDTAGAMRLREAFLFDPVRATLGLIGAAEAKGARIFERSAVRRTRFTRKVADVILTTGAIRTKGIVVATGGPGALFGQLRRHVREQEGFAVVTAPMNAAMKRETGRHASVLTESGGAPHWLRWLSDGRALFAGGLSRPAALRQRDQAVRRWTAELMYELSVRYPVISGLPAEYGWSAPVISTLDGLPWIGAHRNYPFHFFAMALGWHGDSLSWFAAKAALRYFKGESAKGDDALGFSRKG